MQWKKCQGIFAPRVDMDVYAIGCIEALTLQRKADEVFVRRERTGEVAVCDG